MNKLNVGQALVLFAKIIDILKAQGVIDAQGNFSDDLTTDLKAVAAIELELKANGLVVPSEVDKIIAILPLVLQLAR